MFLLALGASSLTVVPQAAKASGPACAIKTVTNRDGIAIRILFASNGAVQQYQVVSSQENVEGAHDMRLDLEKMYGPAGVNAPPLKIISFKSGGGGGLMLPDKAKDSCGRILNYNS